MRSLVTAEIIVPGGLGRGVRDPQFRSARLSDRKHWRAYYLHAHDARARGVDFYLTFTEWLSIWRASGKLSRRGKGADKYCMARFGDVGPYAVGNVRITLFGNNTREAFLGRPRTEAQKRQISKTKTGVRQTVSHRRAISLGLKRAYAEGRR